MYGGVSFAILENRKFQTGPLSMSPDRRKLGRGAHLLGEEQERFVKQCATTPRDAGVRVRIALSKTMFARPSTHTGETLHRNAFIDDSGTWPRAARDRVFQWLSQEHALSVHGDQHLGMAVSYGVYAHRDARFAFTVPGTANRYPRAWWPGVGNGERPKKWQKVTGLFVDDAGIPLEVLAVANPGARSGETDAWGSLRPEEIGYDRGSGYGIVSIDERVRKVTLNLYRLGVSGEQFQGFPVTVDLVCRKEECDNCTHRRT